MQVALGFVNLITLIILPMIPLSALNDSSAIFLLWPILVLWCAYHSENGITFALSCWVSFLILFLVIQLNSTDQ